MNYVKESVSYVSVAPSTWVNEPRERKLKLGHRQPCPLLEQGELALPLIGDLALSLTGQCSGKTGPTRCLRGTVTAEALTDQLSYHPDPHSVF